VNATLDSPVFALNDYGSTPFATAPGAFPNFPAFIRGPGGVLSQDDAGNQLQLEDATMRAQFNKTGSSSYHLRLNPVVHDAITIVVPGNRGTVFQSGRGVHFGNINIQWWETRMVNLNGSLDYIDPTHLPIYLTKDVQLYVGNNPSNCCYAGFHGAPIAGTATAISRCRLLYGLHTYPQECMRGPTAVPVGRCKTSTLLVTRSQSGRMTRSVTTT